MHCARTMAWLATSLLAGCAPLASLPALRPAAHDIAGVERIAILKVDGPAADQARDAVVASFAENRSYSLVDPAVLQASLGPAQSEGESDRAAALAAARHEGIDAVLACHQQPAGPLTAELIAAASGETLAEATSPTGDAAALVAALAPHYEPVEVTLARQWWGDGKASVSAGNALARQGDWKEAEAKWQAAKEADPGNHAALHNLALAAEARQDYREAFELLDRALEQFPAKLYHQTRKAMEQRQTTFLAASRQIEAIKAAADKRHAGAAPLR